ncbi:hypothetical protein KMW28_24635 [Flammeovirga yaeyamensis]|uniref:Uncharacterized protein n=1 Tax=Flammeovirga yaeyamensis TaxID=367791 RepID=A0AAX1N9B9_9BACT|nr:hypothetical protein [Flammeovirga yaeyamensis]MBB3699525.1 hypothetical protein [Flammeovirga yaeyamensis]NMF35219.1 hypothetical protein [Flammeovirga yaeyamensis]QWG04081.1 hypothetical protein KMW28_24635 [Flammeovirga yaeyamensis]
MSIIVIQAIASAISIPTEADNINIHLKDDQMVSVSKKEWKKGKRFCSEDRFAFVRNKQVIFIEKSDIEYIRYESLRTFEKTADFMEEYAKVQELDEEVLKYFHTVKHKKARTSQVLAVGATCMGVLVSPLVLVVAPIPLIQAVSRMRKVEYQYCVKGKEWKSLKNARKKKIKNYKLKATA